jgi:MoxR-like ATPase
MRNTFEDSFDRLAGHVGAFIRGKDDVVRLALVCLFAEGHLLIEDVPGVAKTSLAKAIAGSIDGLRYGRIQFTPDLLPSDVTGSRVFRQGSETFVFEPGPVFANVLLGDEINRASPKTQSALLEVMAERQVTVDGQAYPAPDPFICIATQNPIEHQGTYPLPEAQIDRFLMLLRMGYPSPTDEMQVIVDGIARHTPDASAGKAFGVDRLREMIAQVRAVHVGLHLRGYIVAIVGATREGGANVRLGASPRASIGLATAAQAYAAASGRDFASADDVKAVAVPVLAHRLLLTAQASLTDRSAEHIVEEILDRIEPPGAARVERDR